jgi:glycerol-3-phosphate dehydrogenase
MGATAGDLLARRTRVSLEDPHGGLADPERLAGLLAPALQLSRQEAVAQLDAYRETLTRERGPAVPVRHPSGGDAAASAGSQRPD